MVLYCVRYAELSTTVRNLVNQGLERSVMTLVVLWLLLMQLKMQGADVVVMEILLWLVCYCLEMGLSEKSVGRASL
jgi:hypothetical protein